MNKQPVAIGLLICDQVIVEARTGNVTPVNCFNKKLVPKFPTGRMPFVVFAVLTDGSGEMPLDILAHRLDNYEEVYRFSYSIKFSSPLEEIRCTVRLRGCSFPVAGAYQVSLWVGRESVAQAKIILMEKTQ